MEENREAGELDAAIIDFGQDGAFGDESGRPGLWIGRRGQFGEIGGKTEGDRVGAHEGQKRG